MVMDALALLEDYAKGRLRREVVFRDHMIARDKCLISQFGVCVLNWVQR